MLYKVIPGLGVGRGRNFKHNIVDQTAPLFLSSYLGSHAGHYFILIYIFYFCCSYLSTKMHFGRFGPNIYEIVTWIFSALFQAGAVLFGCSCVFLLVILAVYMLDSCKLIIINVYRPIYLQTWVCFQMITACRFLSVQPQSSSNKNSNCCSVTCRLTVSISLLILVNSLLLIF